MLTLRDCQINIVSPASFFHYLDVVKALFGKQLQLGSLTEYESNLRDRLIVLLLADLFSATPTLKQEESRFQIIALLRKLDPDIFDKFLTKHIANLTKPQ